MGFRASNQEHGILVYASRLDQRSLGHYLKNVCLKHAETLLAKAGVKPDQVPPIDKPRRAPNLGKKLARGKFVAVADAKKPAA